MQHGVVLRAHGNEHGRILRTLTLVHGDGIGWLQEIQFPKNMLTSLLSKSTVRVPSSTSTPLHNSDVAVKHLFFIIVLDLHSLVAGRKSAAELFYGQRACTVEGGL